MILERTLKTVGAGAAIAAAAVVAVIAAACAVYAVAAPALGPAGAYAVVAALAAVGALIGGMMLARREPPKPAATAADGDASMIHRLLEMAKDKPILSVAAAVAAGAFILRNPVLVTAVAKAFMDTRSPPKS